MSSEEQNSEDKETEQPVDTEIEGENPTEDVDRFMTWSAEETDGFNPVDIDSIPEFNVAFAKLVRTATRSSLAFTEILRTEAYIYSYEKFVSRLGGTPVHIFDVFGIKLVKKFEASFFNAWMFAEYLRAHPLIHDDSGLFDLDLFFQNDWSEYWSIKRRSKRAEFTQLFGNRQAHDTNLKKQFDSDISQVTSPSSILDKRNKPKVHSVTSQVSKETRSPIKERTRMSRLSAGDDDPSDPPPSSSDDDDSLPSLVKPKKHFDPSDSGSDSDDSGGVVARRERRRRKRRRKSFGHPRKELDPKTK